MYILRYTRIVFSVSFRNKRENSFVSKCRKPFDHHDCGLLSACCSLRNRCGNELDRLFKNAGNPLFSLLCHADDGRGKRNIAGENSCGRMRDDACRNPFISDQTGICILFYGGSFGRIFSVCKCICAVLPDRLHSFDRKVGNVYSPRRSNQDLPADPSSDHRNFVIRVQKRMFSGGWLRDMDCRSETDDSAAGVCSHRHYHNGFISFCISDR